jgi:Vps54-like protein
LCSLHFVSISTRHLALALNVVRVVEVLLTPLHIRWEQRLQRSSEEVSDPRLGSFLRLRADLGEHKAQLEMKIKAIVAERAQHHCAAAWLDAPGGVQKNDDAYQPFQNFVAELRTLKDILADLLPPQTAADILVGRGDLASLGLAEDSAFGASASALGTSALRICESSSNAGSKAQQQLSRIAARVRNEFDKDVGPQSKKAVTDGFDRRNAPAALRDFERARAGLVKLCCDVVGFAAGKAEETSIGTSGDASNVKGAPAAAIFAPTLMREMEALRLEMSRAKPQKASAKGGRTTASTQKQRDNKNGE